MVKWSLKRLNKCSEAANKAGNGEMGCKEWGLLFGFIALKANYLNQFLQSGSTRTLFSAKVRRVWLHHKISICVVFLAFSLI